MQKIIFKNSTSTEISGGVSLLDENPIINCKNGLKEDQSEFPKNNVAVSTCTGLIWYTSTLYNIAVQLKERILRDPEKKGNK
jgi:hypothetical protein